MITRRTRITASILLIYFIIALQSCGDFEEPFEMQEQTDKLVVYMNDFNTQYLTPAINIFKDKYPDVEVEIVRFSGDSFDEREVYRTMLSTELLAGQGPDLVVEDTQFFPDIYKAMSSGVFVDLNHFIKSDDAFNLDEYNQTALECGVFKDRRYIMPLQYNLPILLTTQEILDAEGIDPADLRTFDGFMRVTEQFNEKYKNNPDKSVFLNMQRNPGHIRYFLPSGIRLIDHERGRVAIDKPKFKRVIDNIIKPIYVRPEEEINFNLGDSIMEYEGLAYQDLLFCLYNAIDVLSVTTYNMLENPSMWASATLFSYGGPAIPFEYKGFLEDSLTPLYFTYPNINDGVTAEVRDFTAIPKSSPNQVNAYNLLKILLSEDIQEGHTLFFGVPVLKSAVRINIINRLNLQWHIFSQYEEKLDEYTAMLANVDSVMMTPFAPYRNFFWEELTPYFEDTMSFDDAYARLVRRLELYVSE